MESDLDAAKALGAVKEVDTGIVFLCSVVSQSLGCILGAMLAPHLTAVRQPMPTAELWVMHGRLTATRASIAGGCRTEVKWIVPVDG